MGARLQRSETGREEVASRPLVAFPAEPPCGQLCRKRATNARIAAQWPTQERCQIGGPENRVAGTWGALIPDRSVGLPTQVSVRVGGSKGQRGEEGQREQRGHYLPEQDWVAVVEGERDVNVLSALGKPVSQFERDLHRIREPPTFLEGAVRRPTGSLRVPVITEP